MKLLAGAYYYLPCVFLLLPLFGQKSLLHMIAIIIVLISTTRVVSLRIVA